MRILSGADYFGQRIAKVYPTDDAESMRTMIRSKAGYERNMNDIQSELAQGQAVAGEVGKIGNTLTNIGLEEIAHKDRMETIEYGKQQGKLAEAKRNKEHSDANVFAVNYASEAEAILKSVINNPDIKDTDKLQAIEDQYTGLKDAFAQTLPPEQQYIVEPVHAKAVATARSSYADYQTQKLTEDAKANVKIIYNQLVDKAAKSPQDADEAIQAWGMVLDNNKALYKAPELVAMRDGFTDHVYENEVKHNLDFRDKDGNYPNAGKIIDVLKATDKDGTPLNYKNMTPLAREAFLSNANEKFFYTKHNMEAMRKAREHEWESNMHLRLKIFEENIKAGIVNQTDFSTKLYKDVKGTKYEPLYNAYKQQGEDPAYQNKLLNEDPLKYGAAMSGVQLKPLNTNDPASMVDAINWNYAVGKRVQAKYGLTYVPVVTTQYINQLAKLIKDDPQGGVKFLQTIAEKFNEGSVQQLAPSHDPIINQLTGGQIVQSIASQMAAVDEGKHAEQAIIVKSAASGDYTAYELATGRKLIRDKAVIMPSGRALENSFHGMLGNAMKDTSFDIPSAFNAFEQLYATAINEKGKTNDLLDADIAQATFKKVVGNVVKVRTLDTIIPNGFTEDEFINTIKSVDAAQVSRAGKVSDNVGGVLDDEVAAKRIRNDGQFYMVAPNTYAVVLEGIKLRRADGRPFYLNFTIPTTPEIFGAEGNVFVEQWKHPGQVFK